MIRIDFDVTPDPNDSIPPQPAPRVGRPIFGDYQVEGELGRGGMGVVFRARQKGLNRLVALKMLTGHYGPDEIARFRAEAETAAGLHHTNIVQIYEVGEDEGAPFFSMEYIESGSLADKLRGAKLSPRETAQLLISVARALHFAHQNGVVHRDMKPANVLLDPDGVPKVTDFGIAKRLTGDTSLTLTGAVIGTPTYMAPEQAKGSSRNVGPAADIYSLGAILYEMLAGRPPFLPEDSETALAVRVITEDPVSPAWHRPGIPRDLETICLKCLEKEPRDRYSSAAAFAEDLRRYLEDESIVARPPTTAVRTVKWIRRHPWRSVAALALVLGLVAAGQRLWDWEFYQRPHIEYAALVDFVHGGLEPVARITKEQAAHSAASLRLTRRGRRGPITLVEVVNARGHPAVLRRIFLPEAIPIYIEGLVGAQPNSEKAPESATVEFSYDGGSATKATARALNGNVLWRMLYDRDAGADPHTGRAHFVNVRGFDAAQPNGASHMEFERDNAGRDVRIEFFNGAGQPMPNGEGVYGYKLQRDGAGRIIHLTNIDGAGKPMPNRGGVTACSFVWDTNSHRTRVEVRDAAGQPAVVKGVAVAITEYDAAGNAARIKLLGADGQLARTDRNQDWVVQEIARNSLGEVTGRKFFKLAAGDQLEVLSEWTISYDEFGHFSEIKTTGASNSHFALRHDERGNLTEETSLDAEGHPVLGEKGYATKRVTYKFDPRAGTSWEETYFDTTGGKSYGKSGYHRFVVEFGPTGVLRRQAMEDLDASRVHYHRNVIEPEYDSQGRQRRNVMRWENEKGELDLEAGLPYAALEQNFDDNGRVFLLWELGCPSRAGAYAFKTETEWHRTGATKRITRQACDAERKPVPFISTGQGARIEEEHDEADQRERIYETGFEESRVGFNTRETKFSGGALQSVTHKRSDRTLLEAVEVFITGVFPQQSKASELKAGDQLLAANGKPVRSAHDWVFNDFPGGWIEVVRDGKTIRVEGFSSGSVGISLEDRAPPARK
jgi:predicted Ser/Thr protein kinase